MNMPRKAPSVPPVPPEVFTLLGRIPIVRKRLRDATGLCEARERKITLAPGLTPVVDLHTYWHEAMHQVFADSAAGLSDELEERLCDILATYFTRAQIDGFLRVTP